MILRHPLQKILAYVNYEPVSNATSRIGGVQLAQIASAEFIVICAILY